MKQPIKQTEPDDIQVISSILQEIDSCISEQEAIITEEREAMKVFNADALTKLLERRVRTQSVLSELESRCRRMVEPSGTEQKMEQLIDAQAPEHADNLQSARIDLARRMQSLEQDYVDNHIHLRAAWSVTTNILEHIGAIEVKQTYQNTTYPPKATR